VASSVLLRGTVVTSVHVHVHAVSTGGNAIGHYLVFGEKVTV
jgi:hypothetical protein